MARACIPEPSEKRREIGDEEGDEEEEIGVERMNIFFFPSLWPALKESLPLIHTYTLVTLFPFSTHEVVFSYHLLNRVCTFSKLQGGFFL